MYKSIIFFLLLFTSTSLLAEVKTVVVVNGELISSLDIEKRISSIRYFSNTKIEQEKARETALQELINEALFEDQARKLNINISSDELNDAILMFLKGLNLSHDEFTKLVENNHLNYDTIVKQIRSQLLWNKIITLKIAPFINISNEEVNNIEQQVNKSSVIISVLEALVPNKSGNAYDIALDLTRKLRNNDFENIGESTISIQKTMLNMAQLPVKLQKALEVLDVDDVSDPIAADNGYLVVKVIDRIKLDPSLLNTTLSLKQIYLPSDESNFKEDYEKLNNLKNQEIDCLVFNKIAEDLALPKVEEVEVKMKELAPYIQASLQKVQIGQITDIIKDTKGNLRLIMLCNMQKSFSNQQEWIKQKIYEQKVTMQSNAFFDNMHKNATIEIY